MTEPLRLTLDRTVAVAVEIRPEEVLGHLTDAQILAECARRGLDEVRDLDTLTGEQIRGARGLLDWPIHRLAAASGVSASTIKRIEDGGDGHARQSKHAAIRRALQAGGVQFVSFGQASGLLQGGLGFAPTGRQVSP